MDIDEMEFPKWIEPHASHISRQGNAPEHVSVIDFASYHVNRVDGSVTVMVMDADEQKRALAAYKAPKDEKSVVIVEDPSGQHIFATPKVADLPT